MVVSYGDNYGDLHAKKKYVIYNRKYFTRSETCLGGFG